MDTLLEMRTAIQSDLNVNSNSSLFPPTTVDLALNRAYIKASRLFVWPQLNDAKKTSTQANQEYYDLPEDWSPDSAYRLEVDDVMYGEDPDGSPLTFADYLIWKSDNTNSKEKKWSVYGNQMFIYPIPTALGSNNISVWGQNNVDKLVNDEDETIFAYNMPECNEAIVLEASTILKRKGESEKPSDFYSVEAKQMLIIAHTKILRATAKYEKVQPFFYVSDMFGKGAIEQEIGEF